MNTLQQIAAVRAILDKVENLIKNDAQFEDYGDGEYDYSESGRRKVWAAKQELIQLLGIETSTLS